MRYLIVDPLGSYASRMMEFLGQLDLEAVAIFSSAARLRSWQGKWAEILGHLTCAAYLADDDHDLRELAAQIDSDWPGGFAGIIPWDEISILLGAELGELLDVGWNSREVIERCRDKHVMKSWLRSRGQVRINASRIVTTAAEALVFREQLGRWPIVVKPTADAGASHVYFPRSTGELLSACQRVMEGGKGKVLLEEYVDGEELAVNGVVDRDGDLLVTDVWLYDKRESHGIPNLYYQSIKVGTDESLFGAVADYAAAVVESLELRRSPIHMEVKVDDRGPCLIEIGARLAGGDQPVLASRLHGRSLFELVACHYLAELPATLRDLDYERYDRYEARIVSGIQAVEIARVEVIHGLEEIRELPSFEDIGFLWPPGCRLPVTRDLDTKSYEVYLIHSDPRQIAHDALQVRRFLRYE